MKLKITKISLILILIALANSLPLSLTLASDNTCSIRIACIIPALPGQNISIVQEQKITQATKQINAPAVFLKDSKETRETNGRKSEVEVKTFYSR